MAGKAEKAPALLIGFGAEGESAEEGSGALAGKALAKAIKSGDGHAIYDAFESLMRECQASSGSSESDDVDDDEDSY